MLTNGHIARLTLAPCKPIGNRVYGLSYRALSIAILAAGLMAVGNAPATARALDFVDAPVTDAVAQIDSMYGIQINLGPGVSESRTVSFDVSNAEGYGACLEAVNDLANALNADYEKQFIVTKLVDGTEPSPPVMDAADAPVVAGDGTMPAEDAIKMLAGMDGATVRFYSPIDGDVTLPGGHSTAGDAARRVAEETDTEWHPVYLLTSRRFGHRNSDATVVGYTSSGSPIWMLPDVTYESPKQPPPEVAPATPPSPGQTETHGAEQAGQPAADQSNTPPAASAPNPNQPYVIGGPSGQGGSPFVSIGQPSSTGISTFSGGPGLIGPGSTSGYQEYGGANATQ